MAQDFTLRVEKAPTFDIRPAAWMAFVLAAGAVVVAAVTTTGDGFKPRVETIDALAGLAIGAFCVDRLLTFIPAWSADPDPDKRTIDIDTLRWGWGALLGGAFVVITGLGAVAALTATEEPIDPGVDRVIAVLAIAGGVKGLARFKDAVNPPKKTSGEETAATDDDVQPPPGTVAYVIGVLCLGIACAIAALAHGDKSGLDLIGPDKAADGMIAFVARFGPVFVAAVIVQQLIERFFGSSLTGPAKKLLTASAAVILGVVAVRFMDLYLLHNVGFFGTAGGPGHLDEALAASTSTERFADVVLTGLVIAAGTAPLHDLAEALKRSATT